MSRPVRRRTFLQGCGLATEAAVIGTGGWLLASPETRNTGSRNEDPTRSAGGFDQAGILYFSPGFFEYSLGPWQPTLPSNPDLVDLWTKTIDWYADNGLNYIVIQLGPYGGDNVPIGSDRIYLGWGYHYVLNFDRFPEARCTVESGNRFRPDARPFSQDEIRRNQEIVRSITDHGCEKGVGVYTHHYNFYAPTCLVDAHSELAHLETLRAGNFVDRELPCWDGRQLLHPDLCWNKPLYREFLVACFEEYCDLFPNAAGILVTPGERARCTCIHCIGPRAGERAARAARYQDSPQKRQTIAHFVETFDRTLRAKGRDRLVRSWIAGINHEWTEVLPKGVKYLTKYSVFDVTDGGPNPIVLPWIDSGHDMGFMKAILGNENAGPIVMVVPEVFDQVAKRSSAHGVTHMTGVCNSAYGLTYKRMRVQTTAEVLFANAFGRRRGNGWEVCEKLYRDIFGEFGPSILKAARDYSEVPLKISRVLGTPLEGYTHEQHLRFANFPGKPRSHPGPIAGINDPADYLARDIVKFGRYVEYLQEHPWSDDFRQKVTGRRQDPIEFFRTITARAKRGVDALEDLTPRVDAEARDEAELLMLSAGIAHSTGVLWEHFMTGRLDYEGALGTAPLETRKNLARKAVQRYELGLHAVRRQLALIERMEPFGVFDPELVLARQREDVRFREEQEFIWLRETLGELL